MMRMKLELCLAAAVAAALAGTAAQAAEVPYPYIDVIQQGADLGVAATGSVPTVTMQGTAVTINYGPGDVVSLAPTETFTLTADYSASLTATDGQPSSYDYTHGTLTIGSPSSPLLTATFTDLVMQSSGTSLFNVVIASSPLTYTGGSLKGTLNGGEIVGSFTIDPGSASMNSLNFADLSKDYSGSNLTAKVGAVVPLPASSWLLLGGLGALALAAQRRRPPPFARTAA